MAQIEDLAQTIVSEVILRLELQNVADLCLRLVQTVLLQEVLDLPEICRDAAGTLAILQGRGAEAFVLCQDPRGFLGPPGAAQESAERIVGFHILGVQLKRFPKIPLCIDEVLEPHQDVT